MAELKPCPFCGGGSILVPLSSCSGKIACIGECHFESATYWDEPMTQPVEERRKWGEIAAEQWNRRCDNAEVEYEEWQNTEADPWEG